MRVSALVFVLIGASCVLACSSSKEETSQDKQTSSNDAGGSNSNPGTGGGSGGGSTGPAVTKVKLAITGQGRIITKDGSLDCSSDGTTTSGVCEGTPPFTLYEAHEFGSDDWQFDHWEPSGETKQSLLVTAWAAPETVTGVFVLH
jgi:hypothetical protein